MTLNLKKIIKIKIKIKTPLGQSKIPITKIKNKMELHGSPHN
jgi:hypothetical protein